MVISSSLPGSFVWNLAWFEVLDIAVFGKVTVHVDEINIDNVVFGVVTTVVDDSVVVDRGFVMEDKWFVVWDIVNKVICGELLFYLLIILLSLVLMTVLL